MFNKNKMNIVNLEKVFNDNKKVLLKDKKKRLKSFQKLKILLIVLIFSINRKKKII